MVSLADTQPIAIPSSKSERSSTKRRVDCLMFPPSNRPLVPGPSRPESSSNKNLPSKMMTLHRKKKSNEVVEALQQTGVLGSKPNVGKPKHLDLMEAVSQKERESRMKQTSGGAKPAVDIKQYNPEAYRTIAYNEYLSQAFGLKDGGKEKVKHSGVQNEAVKKMLAEANQRTVVLQRKEPTKVTPTARHIAQLAAAPAKDLSQLSSKERRPKIQVMIPATKRPQSYSYVHHPSVKARTPPRREEAPSAISPPSTTTKKQMYAEVPARLSVVSPLSVVEMPKPRRPFSALSLEDMTRGMPRSAPPRSHCVDTDSSDDTGDHSDGRSSNYSPQSSMSSLESDSVLTKLAEERRTSLAFSVMSPAAAGVFDNMPLTPKFSRNPRLMKSSASLASQVNMNKPLPPAPGFGEITPLNVSGFPTSRSSSMKARSRIPAPLNVSRTPSLHIASQHRLSRTSSLRSKYTPADLDALDEAFRKTSPTNLPAPAAPTYAQNYLPTLSQAELALEAHLGTIDEDSTLDSIVVPLVHDPLQISRGPGRMEPSRRPPPLPQYQASIGEAANTQPSHTIASRKRLQKRSATHVAMQMRSTSSSHDSHSHSDRESLLRAKRISAPVVGSVGSSDKAHKVLGRSGTATPMERESSSESHWSSSESPRGYTSSSNMSREESLTPESDLSSVPDATFEEVRKRLELLSPKDGEEIYGAYQDPQRKNSASSSVGLPLQIHSNLPTPGKKSQFGQDEIPAVPSIRNLEQYKLSARSSPTIEIDGSPMSPEDLDDESNIHPLRRRGRHDEKPVRSLASIAMSEIPDMYASLPSPAPTLPPLPMSAEEVERQISADAAELVLLRILENLDNLQDLFATATVSRGFYRTFKRHELPLMKHALYGMSPAAWELREMSPPYPGLEKTGKSSPSPNLDYTPTLYLQHYMRDMYTMIALKSMILIHCESFLRADTITALAGGETERASQIDDAFWRVWTFCRVFGCDSGREDDIVAQMDWLRGGVEAKQQRQALVVGNTGDAEGLMANPPSSFGKGNEGGLTAEELYDMTEIWTCLGVLVRGFQGKRQEARDYGVFENVDIPVGDVEQEDSAIGMSNMNMVIWALANFLIEEWTYFLLTLAPPTVLDVTSPHSPTATTFAHAKSRGYTAWSRPSLGASRSTFLKEAVSRVYEEKMCQRYPTINISSSPTALSPSSPSDAQSARQRCHAHAEVIRAKRNDPAFKALPPSEERPMSNYPDVLERLENNSNVPEVPTIPSTLINHSTPSPATPKPMNSPSPLPRVYLAVPSGPQVRDPVDVAVDRLVAMGFDEKKAKKALADTDSGNSVNFEKAVEVLVRERKRDVGSLMNSGYRGRLWKDEE
ncbi:MAG: hypothetical protein LQ352_005443 [Teloschistes flavicans]|nr:MAG: hypothetical protein LQ352_005443 [Teloschistes flavicans]